MQLDSILYSSLAYIAPYCVNKAVLWDCIVAINYIDNILYLITHKFLGTPRISLILKALVVFLMLLYSLNTWVAGVKLLRDAPEQLATL